MKRTRIVLIIILIIGQIFLLGAGLFEKITIKTEDNRPLVSLGSIKGLGDEPGIITDSSDTEESDADITQETPVTPTVTPKIPSPTKPVEKISKISIKVYKGTHYYLNNVLVDKDKLMDSFNSMYSPLCTVEIVDVYTDYSEIMELKKQIEEDKRISVEIKIDDKVQ